MRISPPRSTHDVVARYQQAVLDQSADDLAALYAVDGVHEVPFLFPGMPPRHVGRDEIRAAYGRAWSAGVVRPTSFRDVRIHDVDETGTVVVEQTLTGTNTATGAAFAFPGVLVLRVRDGLLVETRDYMDGLRIARSLGREPGGQVR